MPPDTAWLFSKESVFFMEENLLKALRDLVPGLTLRTHVPYREVTSFGIGGELPVLAEPADDIELSKLFRFATQHHIPMMVIGGGSNIAGMDKAFDGIAVRLIRRPFSAVRTGRTSHVTAGAAIRLGELARLAAKAGFGGLAGLVGIPGSLGGAIRMNAGANGSSIGEFVVQLCGCRANGSIWTAEGSEIQWGYRSSSIPADVIITSAILKLTKVDPDQELARISEEHAKRREREPRGRTAGCIFKNPGTDESAGRLIDSCGFKGMHCGNIEVSGEHANYLLNSGEASEEELLELMIRIRRGVAEKTGLYLEPEVVLADPDALRRYHDAVPAPKVAVLMGGVSSEREVSLRSGAAVAAALRNGGYRVTEIDLQTCEVTQEMRDADVVYSLLHGGFGEDGKLQKVMEEANLKFVGSGSAASELMMDKLATKRMLDNLGLPTAKWAEVTRDKREFPAHLTFPVVVKAPWEGSTVGIAVVNTPDQWDAELDKIFEYDSTLLVEEFVKGVEITVPIVGDKVLPAIEIRSPHGFYDYDAKYVYKTGKTQYFCPTETVSQTALERAGAAALKFYQAAGCRDILRVDFIVDKDDTPYILEGNSIPGCTATSLVPKAAKVAGISFERMTAGLVQAAWKRK